MSRRRPMSRPFHAGLIAAAALTVGAGAPAAGPRPAPEPPPHEVEALVVTPHAECEEAIRSGGDAPRIVSTFPRKGAVVRPGLVVLRVTFDRPMTCSGAFTAAYSLPDPCPRAPQRLVLSYDRRSIRTLCLVAANTRYGVSLSEEQDFKFVSMDGGMLEPTRLVFSTSAEPPVETVRAALAEDAESAALRREPPLPRP